MIPCANGAVGDLNERHSYCVSELSQAILGSWFAATFNTTWHGKSNDVKLLTTALAVFVAIFGVFFFPIETKYVVRNLLAASGMEPHPGNVFLAQLVLHGGLLLLIGFGVASVALRALDVSSHIEALGAHRRWLRRGLLGVGAYLVAVPVLFVLSAIPYGGGAAPGWTWVILLASWISLGYGLFLTLFRELKSAKTSNA
jgi:hypothetical protein